MKCCFILKQLRTVGFYQGQVVNYILFIAVTVIGFFVNKYKWYQILAGSVAGVAFYFLASNFAQWAGNGPDVNGVPYANNLDGLMACIYAGVPFLKGSF